jgi:hypothetical protein
MDALFGALGSIFATGIGILLLAVVAGVVFILWDWRLALLSAVLVNLGSSSVLVLIHNVPGLWAAGQMIAVTLSAAMLAIAGFLHPHPISLRQAGYWPLRLMALIFISAAWWYLDPGYAFPGFSQPETDLLLWTGLCALALWSFSTSPLMAGAGLLLWSTPMYALASVLLPGSGLPAVIGIADILLALACSYLALLEPSNARGLAQGVTPRAAAARSSLARTPLLGRRTPKAPGAPAPGAPAPGAPSPGGSLAPEAVKEQVAS